MKSLKDIKRQIEAGEFEFSRHAFRRAVERNIRETEIRESAPSLEVIEDYPDDKYSPSSLLLGFTKNKRPLHLHISRSEGDHVRIITIYEPDESRWNNLKRRNEDV